jgi:sporulation protein YunB
MIFLFLNRSLINLLVIFLVTIAIMFYGNFALKKSYASIASLEINNLLSQILNQIVLQDELIDEDLLIKDEVYASFQINKINYLNSYMGMYILEELNKINQGDSPYLSSNYQNYQIDGLIYQMPLSLIFNNVFLNGIMNDIPLKIKFYGNVITKIKYNIEEFGVNNSIVSILLNINFSYLVYLPLFQDNQELTLDIPLCMKIIEGEVPSYILGSYIIGDSNE